MVAGDSVDVSNMLLSRAKPESLKMDIKPAFVFALSLITITLPNNKKKHFPRCHSSFDPRTISSHHHGLAARLDATQPPG